jgi:hypothetical protein
MIPFYSLPVENDVIARRQKAFEAITKTNHFPTELVSCQHYGAQNRIEPGTIPTAGQNTNARFHFRKPTMFGAIASPLRQGERMKVRGWIAAAVLAKPSPSPSHRERRPSARMLR